MDENNDRSSEMAKPDERDVPPLPEAADGQILIYQDGSLNLQVRLDGRTVWLTQAGMAELYQTTPQNITLHIKAIYEEGELDEQATCKDYLQVRLEGTRKVQRLLRHYSLDVILAVGYRVRSARGTQFRRWATSRLRELLVKGFVLDDERIKAGRTIGQDYFDELLARIRHRPMHMSEWAARLDSFLQFNERNVLTHAGTISHELAEEHALAQFAVFDQQRLEAQATRPTHDFDRAVEEVKRLAGGGSSEGPSPNAPSSPRRRKGQKHS